MSGGTSPRTGGGLARLARAAAKARAAQVDRDALIRDLRAAGASLREIAGAAGMSHSGIVRVLERKVRADGNQ